VAVGGDQDSPICSGIASTCADYDNLGGPGFDAPGSVPPPLEVPARLMSAVEPGAPLGPPRAGSPITVVESADAAAGGAAALQGLRENRSVQQLLQAFTKAVGDGVGVSLALEGIGVLVVEARLVLRPLLVLQLRFNCVERVVPLSQVEDVRVERACSGGSSGAWLVHLGLDDDQAFDFVFDGTQQGEREAHYMGGCLRLLSEDARAQSMKVKDARGLLARKSARVVRASSGFCTAPTLKPLVTSGAAPGLRGAVDQADRVCARPQALQAVLSSRETHPSQPG